MIQNFFLQLGKIEKIIKGKLFDEKVDFKKVKYRREHDRDMENDEIEAYKFKLFITYSLVACAPLVFFIVVLMGR